MVNKLAKFYYGSAIITIILMNAYNFGIDGSTLRHVFQFDFYFVTAAALIFAVLMHVYSSIRLMPAAKFDRCTEGATKEEEWRVFELLNRFPIEVLWCVLVYGALFSASYHSLELFWFRQRSFGELVLRHIIVEQTFSAALSIVFMAIVHSSLRPYVKGLSKTNTLAGASRSFVPLWVAAFASVLLLTIVPQMWFIRNEILRNERPSLAAVIVISAVSLLFGAYLMYLLFSQLQKEIKALAEAIKKLSGGQLTQRRMLSITTKDEIGQLAQLFNTLQTKSAKEHEDLQNDLRLAAAVHKMLLPEPVHKFDGVSITCFHETKKEVGGTFYDCAKLSDGRVAAVFGEVSGQGLPASLMMTAALMLLRNELRAGGTRGAGEIISRLNKAIIDTSNGEVLINLGLALIDPHRCTIEYANAGQAAPFLMRDGSLELLPVSSLPLGASCETVYRSTIWEQLPGDRMLFYTSGLMEHFREHPKESGFRSFQLFVGLQPSNATVDELMEAIWAVRKMNADLADSILMIAEFGVESREGRLYA